MRAELPSPPGWWFSSSRRWSFTKGWWKRRGHDSRIEVEYGIEKSKVDSIRSRLFGALRVFYQERDRLRLLVQFRKAFIDRLLAEGEESAGATAGDYQRDAAEKDREYDSRASALEGKRELNPEETARLKQLWKKRRGKS